MDVKLQLRLPRNVRDWLKKEAKRHDRSMNGHMVAILKEKMAEQSAGNEKTSDQQG